MIHVTMLCLLSSAFAQDAETPTTAEGWYKRAYDRRHNKELDGAIEQVLYEWLRKHELLPTYFRVEGISEHPVPLAPAAGVPGM